MRTILLVIILMFLGGIGVRASHFTPVYSGNPFNPMSFIFTSATINGIPLDIGDEIGIFDGNLCVGSGVFNGSFPFAIPAGMDDNTTPSILDGFTLGNTASFIIWDNDQGTEVNQVTSAYTLGNGVFSSQGTAALSLSGIAASSLSVSIQADSEIECANEATGQLSVLVTGGVMPVQYIWSNGASTSTMSGLGAGNYSVTITDFAGTTADASFQLSEPVELNVTGSVTSLNCNGGTEGVIDLTVSGGTPAYSYQWNNGATLQTISSLAAGNYQVTVTDANECSLLATYNVTEPNAILISESISTISCFGEEDGSISCSVTGGTGPYSFSWSNGAVSQSINALSAGNYSVTVTDQYGCTTSQLYQVTSPTEMILTGIVQNESCFGSQNGAIDITIVGGTQPYNYYWSVNSQSEDIINLSEGEYSVQVSDANGCQVTDTFNILTEYDLEIIPSVTDESCLGQEDGTITLAVSSGGSPYSFAWNNGASTEVLSNLSGGSYSVTVTDANGCSTSELITVGQGIELEPEILTMNETCSGMNDGTINLTVTNGVPPFFYNWNNGATTVDLENLEPGLYIVTITDSIGCTTIDSSIIVSVPALNIVSEIINESCSLCSDGSISLTVAGGTSPYSYIWSNGSTGSAIGNLVQGSYTVLVSDALGCTETVYFDVSLELSIPFPPWYYTSTNINHTIYIADTVQITIDGAPIQPGDFIGVFYDSSGTLACAGYLAWNNQSTYLTAWGNDPLTTMPDGFANAEEFSWKVWRASDSLVFDMAPVYDQTGFFPDSGFFTSNGLSGLMSMVYVGIQTQTISFPAGWSIWSTYIDPQFPSLDSIFFAVQNDLSIVKNGNGEVYWPLFGVNLIGNVVIGEGYQAKFLSNQSISISGQQIVPENTPLDLPVGWSIRAYLRTSPADVVSLMSQVVSDLEIIKNGQGMVYWPAYGVNILGNFIPGQGYQFKMNSHRVLVYPPNSQVLNKSETGYVLQFAEIINSGNNMTLGIPLSAWESKPRVGDIVIALDKNKVVGATRFNDEFTILSVWGDDPYTPQYEGPQDNDEIDLAIGSYNHGSFKVGKRISPEQIHWQKGNHSFGSNKIALVDRINNKKRLQIYPNPVVEQLNIDCSTMSEGRIIIYSSDGKLIVETPLGGQSETYFSLDVSDFMTGMYFYKFETATEIVSGQFLIVR